MTMTTRTKTKTATNPRTKSLQSSENPMNSYRRPVGCLSPPFRWRDWRLSIFLAFCVAPLNGTASSNRGRSGGALAAGDRMNGFLDLRNRVVADLIQFDMRQVRHFVRGDHAVDDRGTIERESLVQLETQ
jgi:hypothetical protein